MAKKRFLKATEVERVFNEVRENDKDFASGEVAIIKTIVETAKRNGRIGDKVLLVLPPHYVHIPEWQRTADLLRASNIGANYNKYKWEVPKIIYVNGKLFCIDGMHRIFGALLAQLPDIVVEVMEISEKDAIELFLGQTTDRGSMKPMDYYNASIKANKPDYVAFKEICHKYNVQVKGDDALANPVGVFTSITDGVRMDKVTLDKILNLINRLRWNGKENGAGATTVYGAKVIRSIKKMYAYYNGNEIQMERILMQNCKGTEWFIENLAEMPQYYIFDMLNKIVSDSLAKTAFIEKTARRVG